MRRGALLQDSALAHLYHDLAGAAAVIKAVPKQELLVARHALGEVLAALWDLRSAVK